MTGVIILAAGASTRLGQPKQNLVYNGLTLLQRTVETALSSGSKPVVVVLGANEAVIRPTIANYPVSIINNPNWGQGMASSITTGIQEITHYHCSSVIVILCDQPFITPLLLNSLIQQRQISGKPIVACRYGNDVVGVPALFDAAMFGTLLALKGDEGARHVIKNQPENTVTVDFIKGQVDIDTIIDYEQLRAQ